VATPIIYPVELPTPQASQVTAAERRVLEDRDNPQGDARPKQRDRREFERLTWPPLDQQQAGVLRAWWKTDLLKGGAWFLATWPLPRGQVAAVRKFSQPLQWEWMAGGFWRVSALTEVRGRGMAPQAYGGCDCSHTAWLTGFEGPIVGDPLEFPMENGVATIDAGAAALTISTDAPLYQGASLVAQMDEEVIVTFTEPDVEVPGAWTLNLSVLAEEGSLANGYGRIRVYSASGEVARITWEDNFDGSFKFNWFFVPSFSSGEEGGFAFDVAHDVEMSFGEGGFRVFVNGVRLFQEITGTEPEGVDHMELLCVQFAPTEIPFKLDEIRLTNRVEHVDDYGVDLPFCRCD
jgi:hypothetical protein